MIELFRDDLVIRHNGRDNLYSTKWIGNPTFREGRILEASKSAKEFGLDAYVSFPDREETFLEIQQRENGLTRDYLSLLLENTGCVREAKISSSETLEPVKSMKDLQNLFPIEEIAEHIMEDSSEKFAKRKSEYDFSDYLIGLVLSLKMQRKLSWVGDISKIKLPPRDLTTKIR